MNEYVFVNDWQREFATAKNEHATLYAVSDKRSQELRTQRRKSEIGLWDFQDAIWGAGNRSLLL